MRRVLAVVLIITAFVGTGFVLRRALASDETRIRRLVEGLVDGFNDERAARALRGFARDFLDETSGADRELVHTAVVHLFFTRRDPETKEFTLRLEVPEDTLIIEVLTPDEAARANGVLRLFQRAAEREELLWEVSFQGQLAQIDDRWRFVRSTHETVGGTRPR